MPDLFGLPPVPERRTPRPRGHAWKPGTGPAGETCRTCAHFRRVRYHAGVFLKCGANEAAWTHSRRTDIRAGDAACREWQPPSTAPA